MAAAVWKTAFVVLQDRDGRVFVDNCPKHFGEQLDRQATAEDAIYMLSVAVEQFRAEQLVAMVVQGLQSRKDT